MAWLTNWNYRKSVTISNAGSALSDYQVLITVDTASLVTTGKMRSDCGDIRFTDDDGSTLLQYWIESGPNTASTKIWVKIPSVPTSKTIYVYYGNPSVTSLSNGLNTFDFFDDMSVDTIGTNWFTNYKNPTITGGTLSIGGGCAGGWAVISKALPFNSNGYAFQFRNKTNSTSYCADNHYAGVQTSANFNQWNFFSSKNVGTRIGFNDMVTNTDGGGATSGVWWTVVGKVLPTGTVVEVYNGTTMQVTASSADNYPATSHHMFFGYFSVAELDDVILRKYTSPEPTFSALGLEQTPPNITATNTTISTNDTPCRVGICTVTVNVTWTNYGGSSSDFIPNITIDGTPYSIPYPLESLGVGASITKTFTVSGLTVGTRNICPYPN